MSNFDYDKALTNVKNASDNYEAMYRSLIQELEKSGNEIPADSDQFVTNIILQIKQPDLIDRSELINLFIGTFNHGRKLNSTFSSFHKNLNDSYAFEINRQIKERRAERTDMWRLWRDKLIRWTAGAIAALLLYSGFVELSSSFGFLHIPIRDLVTPK